MRRLLYLFAALPPALLFACGESKPNPAPSPPATIQHAAASGSARRDPPAKGAPAKVEPQAAPASDAGAAPEAPQHYLGALAMQTPVLSEMEWPKEGKKNGSVRLGYLRQGGRAAVIPEPHVKSNCSEGWYELVAGGFVCGKYATLDLNHPRFRSAPHAPYTDRPLPYDYGYNVANGTPIYRVVPSREERVSNEPWLSAPKKKKREDGDGSESEGDAPAPTNVSASTSSGGGDGDAGATTPWYLRDYDGGKPQVTLDDLRGDGPVYRRMVRGFFLGLDKQFISGGARWWRTTDTLIVPADRVMTWKMPTEFHGMWLDERGKSDGDTAAPAKPSKGPGLVGFILNGKAKKYTMSPEHKHVSTGGDLSRFMAVRLTGETATVGSNTYSETEEGWWMRDADGTRTKPGGAPADLKPGEKWVDVSVGLQTLVLFEGDKPVYATLVSTGRTSPIKDKDHATPLGSWRIREKHVASTMDGDVASDGPYSIEDVPWIMYFQGSYALHGAFWHANFGHKQSHGCVNLSPVDAKAIFGWTEPALPEGWHGVSSNAEHPGSWVVVHD
jgi:hypothetical protein